MNPSLEFSHKMAQAYANACKPLCQRLNLPQTAFDILLFLGNNPEYTTARDIVVLRHIKANLVSIHVERLVKEGLLLRQTDHDDRRKTILLLTDKAQPIVEQGRQMQEQFFQQLFQGVEAPQREAFFETLSIIGQNLDRYFK